MFSIRICRALLAIGLHSLVLAVEHTKAAPTNACDTLSGLLPGDVFFANSTGYIEGNNYWSSRQAEVHPACFVAPKDAKGVSIVMKTVSSTDTPFSVKGGGHTAFAGGSNVAGGVVIDLQKLNAIVISDDRQTVSVGAGNRWIDVSEKLDPLNLAVVGGRAADVGVSGLTLGGGISYFSGSKGWACDNVRNFEVVVASGDIVNASPTSNPDLYWALRGGGGSNFGIVTRFDLASFEQGDLWSSSLIFPGALNRTLVKLFQDLAVNGLPSDPAAHTYFVLTYEPSLGGYIVLTSFFHSSITSAPESTPEIFVPFQSVPSVILNQTSAVNISAQSRSIDQAYGSRQSWRVTTIRATSAEFLADIVPLFEAHNKALFAAADGSSVTPFLVFQPISVNILEQMQKNGGNALGLHPSDGPLMMVQLSTTWENPQLDALVEESSRQLIDRVESMAKKQGLYNGFVYMNYAGQSQSVQRRYGKNNERKLKRIARQWDPKQKLAKLWTGYFKLEL